jgi:hypothetical protein
LLASYEVERRPVALRNVERSAVHASVHQQYTAWVAEKGRGCIVSDTEEARKLKKDIADFIGDHDGENKDHGIELGYRFPNSPVVMGDARTGDVEKAAEWPPRHYTPSTAAGGRSPHVYLRDGKASIFDLYGKDFTVVDFTPGGDLSRVFEEVALGFRIPLKRVHLPDEPHVRDIWQCGAVLVRPDGFISWRSDDQSGDRLIAKDHVQNILLVAVGQRCAT